MSGAVYGKVDFLVIFANIGILYVPTLDYTDLALFLRKEELLRLEKDQCVLIQSLFFDRKDELEHMQKACWSIIEKNQSNADIQIKTIEQLHIISDKLINSLPYHVEFGARRH